MNVDNKIFLNVHFRCGSREWIYKGTHELIIFNHKRKMPSYNIKCFCLHFTDEESTPICGPGNQRCMFDAQSKYLTFFNVS